VALVVMDSSALIAHVEREAGWENIEQLLPSALVTTVNLAEVAQYWAKKGLDREEVARGIDALCVVAVAPDLLLALDAGTMIAHTARRGLSLADRFCLALARRENIPALTADRAWAEIADAVGVRVELLR